MPTVEVRVAGHVFIAQGDLTKLACDAWLLPCDVGLGVRSFWLEGVGLDIDAWLATLQEQPLPDGWADDGTRVVRAVGWPPGLPQPWLVNVGLLGGTPADWYAEGVRQFLEATARELAGKASSVGRAKPLVALPLVGTGLGGASEIKGDVIRAVVAALYTAA